MKSLVQFKNESKEKPIYSEWDIHSYVDYMLEAWFRNNQNYVNILNATDTCVKIDLVKNCEIAVTLLECLADVVKLHFVSARDNKIDYEIQTSENAFYKAFKVIEAIVSLDFKDNNQNKAEELKEEVKQLKERVDILIKNCNEKYEKWVEELNKTKTDDSCLSNSVCLPCDCCGCAC